MPIRGKVSPDTKFICINTIQVSTAKINFFWAFRQRTLRQFLYGCFVASAQVQKYSSRELPVPAA
jgi:hypothetical protein